MRGGTCLLWGETFRELPLSRLHWIASTCIFLERFVSKTSARSKVALIERIQLLRNVGQFDSVNAGAQLPFAKLTLIYAENGRGKTTLASILRSLGSGDPDLVIERHRLGATNPPHVVLRIAGTVVQFQNDAWSAPMPQIASFDDAFVAANVCSGVEIAAGHRQNLHELILGAQGVALNATLQGCVTSIEAHNRVLAQKSSAIPEDMRGGMSLDAFCALGEISAIEAAIEDAERNLAAGRAADAIRQRADFAPLSLPTFDVASINVLLARTLPDLEAEAAASVRDHLHRLGHGGESWVSDGMSRIQSASDGSGYEVCPFAPRTSLVRQFCNTTKPILARPMVPLRIRSTKPNKTSIQRMLVTFWRSSSGPCVSQSRIAHSGRNLLSFRK